MLGCWQELIIETLIESKNWERIRMIKNIVLDVGRVLVAWQPSELMKTLGFSDETIEILTEALFTSGVWNETDRGVLSDEAFLELAVSKAPEYKREILLFWNNVDKAIWQLSYVKEWIGAMKKAGYRIYILSNYGSWTYEKTKADALNFLEYVDGAIFSYEVKMIKPDAGIFHALFEKYGLQPEECVFLDDLAANIEGAKAVGMHGIVFTGLADALAELEKIDVKIEI